MLTNYVIHHKFRIITGLGLSCYNPTPIIISLDWFQTVGGDVGDGDGSHTVDLDEEVLVLLDTFDDTLDTLEATSGDADTTTHVGRVSDLKKNGRAILYGGDLYEILHLTVWNVKQLFMSIGKELCHVPHGVKFFPMHFQMCQNLLGGTDEDEVVDGRNKGLARAV